MGIINRIKKGFRQPKKLTRKQRERQEQIKGFIDGYKKLCEEQRLQFDAVIEVTPDGILPKMTIKEHRPKPQVKDWDECKKENEEIRKRLNEKKQEKADG